MKCIETQEVEEIITETREIEGEVKETKDEHTHTHGVSEGPWGRAGGLFGDPVRAAG